LEKQKGEIMNENRINLVRALLDFYNSAKTQKSPEEFLEGVWYQMQHSCCQYRYHGKEIRELFAAARDAGFVEFLSNSGEWRKLPSELNYISRISDSAVIRVHPGKSMPPLKEDLQEREPYPEFNLADEEGFVHVLINATGDFRRVHISDCCAYLLRDDTGGPKKQVGYWAWNSDKTEKIWLSSLYFLRSKKGGIMEYSQLSEANIAKQELTPDRADGIVCLPE
jgi:hypothetical protein